MDYDHLHEEMEIDEPEDTDANITESQMAIVPIPSITPIVSWFQEYINLTL